MTEIDKNTKYITESELAERWSCSVKTIQKARYEGGGVPYFKAKGIRIVRYKLSDIEAYEQASTHEHGGTS